MVANRLSEIGYWNILLLEAGGDETEISDVPLLAGYLQLSKLDWKYKTEPQGTSCLGKISIKIYLNFTTKFVKNVIFTFLLHNLVRKLLYQNILLAMPHGFTRSFRSRGNIGIKVLAYVLF